MNISINTTKYIFYFTTLLGSLFSGYLSGVKLFNDSCAFGQTCPLFFGIPACYIGFVLFLTLFIMSVVILFFKNVSFHVYRNALAVGVAGFLYSAYYTIQEVVQSSRGQFEWSFFGMSTCAYGFIFFTIALISSYYIYKKTRYKDYNNKE